MNTQTPQIGFISLGCPKATVDSERILSQIRHDGYGITDSYDNADLVIINTCSFIKEARDESYVAIEEAIEEHGQVIVTGCLGTQRESLLEVFPDLLAVSGPDAYKDVMTAVYEQLGKPQIINDYDDRFPIGIKLTPKHYSYLKISEGCNHKCSFCIIPDIRGKHVSRPLEQLLDEAHNLVNNGVKELLVVSQDTSAYGIDLKYSTSFYNGRPVRNDFYHLVEELSKIDAWVRLHYVYPYPHVDKIIPFMGNGGIAPYLDIPMQHASKPILKAMRRPAHAEKMLERIHHWRQQCPDLTIRSTMITGFPGETDADFETLLNFIEDAQINRLGAFAYSNVTEAQAYKMDNHVPEHIKQERLTELMDVQERVSVQLLAQKVGQRMQVICDETTEQGESICRSIVDSPEVDGHVIVDSKLSVGEFHQVRITHSNAHDLFASVDI